MPDDKELMVEVLGQVMMLESEASTSTLEELKQRFFEEGYSMINCLWIKMLLLMKENDVKCID